MKSSASRPAPGPVRIGCAGWSIPKQTAANFLSRGSHLERYSRVLNACEINSSFYRSHKEETWARWANATPAEFRFSVKAPKTITHEAKLSCSSQELSAFFEQIRFLDGKLGPILFQLPPSLEFEPARTRIFLSLLRRVYKEDVVLEPRHGSWFNDSADQLLQQFHIARVAADPACVPAAYRPGGLYDIVYFRLHGSPRRYYSSYDQHFLTTLATQIASVAAKTRVWCIFDNTASGSAIENAIELSVILTKIHDSQDPAAETQPRNNRLLR